MHPCFEKEVEFVCVHMLPVATAGYGQQSQEGQQGSEGQQSEHIEERIQAQEDAKHHQLHERTSQQAEWRRFFHKHKL